MSCNPFSPSTMNYAQVIPSEANLNALLAEFGNTIGYSPVGAYTEANLNAGIVFLETLVENIRVNSVLASAYPETITRVVEGAPISNLEYEEFLQFSRIESDPQIYQDIYNEFTGTGGTGIGTLIIDITDIEQLPDELLEYLNAIEAFNNDNYASKTTGNFCSAFNGLVDAFFKIQEIALTVPAVFKAIEEALKNLVDTIVEKVKDIASGIINKAINFIGAIESTLARIQNFFSEENIENIKKKIEEFIGSVSNKFENLTPEVIAQLLFKFCQLASAIESLMMGPVNSLSSLAAKFQLINGQLTASSTENILIARLYGASIIDRQKLEAIKSELAAKGNGAVSETKDYEAPPNNENYITTPATEFEKRMVSEIKTLTVDQVRSGNFSASKYLDLTPLIASGQKNVNIRKSEKIEYAWQWVKSDVWLKTIRVSQRINKRLKINSGYRTLGRGSPIRHPKKIALDISYDSWKGVGNGKVYGDFNAMIRVCSQEGFTCIGVYPPSNDGAYFIHVDIHPVRNYWPPKGKSIPEELKAYLNKHKADGFRKGGDKIPRSASADENAIAAAPVSTSPGPAFPVVANTVPTTPTAGPQ